MNRRIIFIHVFITIHLLILLRNDDSMYLIVKNCTFKKLSKYVHISTVLMDQAQDDGTTPSESERKPYQRIKCPYCGDYFCSRQLYYKHANRVHK